MQKSINFDKVFIEVLFFLSMIFIFLNMYSRSINNSVYLNVSHSIEIVIAFLSVVYCILQIKNKKIYIDSTTFIVALLLIYQWLIIFINGTFYFPYYIIDTTTWPALFLAFSVYSKKKDLPPGIKKTVFFLYLVIFGLCIFTIKSATGQIIAGYIFLTYFAVTFLPLILKLTTKSATKKICIFLACIIVVFANKRTGMIALFFGLLVYYIIETLKNKNKNKLKKIIFVFLIILISYIVVFYLIENSNLDIFIRLRNITQDGGSGRNRIWRVIIDSFNESTVMQKLFGHGFQSVYYQLRPLGNYSMAHNSYLEYLYDYGFVGLILLLAVLFAFMKKAYTFFVNKDNNSSVFIMGIIIALFFSMFSYFFEQSLVIIPLSIFWGIVCGEQRRKDLYEKEN